MRRKKKFDSIKVINRTLDRSLSSVGLWPKARQTKSHSWFSLLMDEITFAPPRRRRR